VATIKATRALPLALAMAGLLAGAGWTEPPIPKKEPDSGIIVRGQTGKALDNFLRNATPTTHGDQIARWNDRLCAKLFDLDPVVGDPVVETFIGNRIYGIASAHHVPIAPSKGCTTNVAIIFSNDSDTLTQSVLTQFSRNYADVENHWLTGEEIRQTKTPRAVRWLSLDASVQGQGTNTASHIRRQTHAAIVSSIIIVDIKRIGGLKWGQLADYIAMVALTNPTLGGNYAGQDSILALFETNSGQPPKALTAQDDRLLTGLYMSGSDYSAGVQRGEMRRIMKKSASGGSQHDDTAQP
jgi:hypothetical protein